MRISGSKVLLILVFVPLFTFYILHSTFYIPIIHAQCQAPNTRNEGLISATGTITGVFGNLEQVCIVNTQDASYRDFKVPSYRDLENQFYTLSRAPGNVKKSIDSAILSGQDWNFTGAAAGNGIYLKTGSVVLRSVQGSGTQVIFIRANLDITGNIAYAETDSASGLVFVVGGNINIGKDVTKVNAVLISSGIICTATDTNGDCLVGTTNAAVDNPQLIINGSLISLSKEDLANKSAIKLGRNLQLNTVAAEIIKKQPKYLYNLRNGLFTRDLIITTEDQSYPITPAAAPSPPPSAVPDASCNPLPTNPTGIPDNLRIPGCVYLH